MVDTALFDEIRGYSYGILSFIDKNGYPFSVPLTFQKKNESLIARKPKSLAYDFVKPQRASVIFHGVNEDFTNPRQILLKGQIIETRGELLFIMESFSRGKVVTRDATDDFIRQAKKRAQKYLDERGLKWYRIREY